MPPLAIAPTPSVQVPMSVTSATRARRAPKKQASAPVPRTWIRIGSVRSLAIPFARDRPKDVLVERVGVGRLGETPRGDVFDVCGPGADSDRGNREAARDEAGEPVRDRFEDERVTARVLESVRVLDEVSRRGGRLTLSLEAAELVHLLRRQADVAYDRDSRSDEGPNRRHDLAAAFQLHGVHAALLQESARVSHRVADRGLVREKRHVADEMRDLRTARDGAGVDSILVGDSLGM